MPQLAAQRRARGLAPIASTHGVIQQPLGHVWLELLTAAADYAGVECGTPHPRRLLRGAAALGLWWPHARQEAGALQAGGDSTRRDPQPHRRRLSERRLRVDRVALHGRVLRQAISFAAIRQWKQFVLPTDDVPIQLPIVAGKSARWPLVTSFTSSRFCGDSNRYGGGD